MEDNAVRLTPGAIEAVRVLLYTTAWTEFFVPALTSMKENWALLLMDPSDRRKSEYPDDYIRGCFATIDAFLKLPEQLVAEHDQQKEQLEREQAAMEEYRVRARLGSVGPLVPLPEADDRL